MKINKIAGRTYHDPNMNYVFPWILKFDKIINTVLLQYLL